MYRYPVPLLLLLSMVVTVAVAQPRIIGGQQARLGQFPYQVSVRTGGHFLCGGAIIAPRWIITAAHCTYYNPHSYSIVAGALLRYTDGRIYPVDRIIVPEQYSRATPRNDVALLRLAEEIEFGDNVQAIPFNGAFVGGHQQGVISGWGVSRTNATDQEVLHFLYVTILSNEECQKHVAQYGLFVRNNSICALPEKGHGVCEGDSGGPLVVNGVLVGLSSWLVDGCADGFAEVFTRVSAYAQWIDEQMKEIRD